MGQITTDQSHQIIAALTTNCEWSGIDFVASGLQDLVIRDPRGAGQQFEAFLRNGCRLAVETFFRGTGELTIKIPALKRPTLAELQAEWSGIKEIIRDISTEEPVTLKLGTVLRADETKSIGGSEYERRILALQNAGRTLGWQHRKWLIEHQTEFPEFMSLLGKVYIDFPGLVVLSVGGGRDVPYAGDGGERWDGSWHWLDSDFRQGGRIAVSAE